MPGRIDDDVGPLRRAELDLRGVDGDVLLLLLEQRIEQEGVFELHPLRSRGLAWICSTLPSGSELVS